jgi:hypothetical protein
MSVYKHQLDRVREIERNRKSAPFVYADGLTEKDIEFDKREATRKKMQGYPGLSDSEILSLVKASKSPTPIKPPKKPRIPGVLGGFEKIDPIPISITPIGTRNAYAVFSYREWSDEYRVRSRIQTSEKPTPPENYGQRITQMLSQRGARKLAESCAYVASQFQGYTTFLTLTFNQEQRDRVLAESNYCRLSDKVLIEPTTIQKEVSRLCDSLTKMWQRGWLAEFAVNGQRIACIGKNGECLGEKGRPDQPLLYCWVAEAPDNEYGEPNPHVHMLIRWRVPKIIFRAWAKRIESIWGNGFATLEKIKDGQAAAAYMMKAAGYLCKAQGKSDQGIIKGNRYNISREARAPDWVVIEEHELYNMSRLIVEVHDHLTEHYGRQYAMRRALNQKRDSFPKGSKMRKAIDKNLMEVRRELNALPVVANKYQLILKGKQAFCEFIAWACSPGHWLASVCNWLPEKHRGNNWKPVTKYRRI